MTFGSFGRAVASLVDADRSNSRGRKLCADLFVAARVLGNTVNKQHQRSRWAVGQPLAASLPITFSVGPIVDQARSTHSQSIGTQQTPLAWSL